MVPRQVSLTSHLPSGRGHSSRPFSTHIEQLTPLQLIPLIGVEQRVQRYAAGQDQAIR